MGYWYQFQYPVPVQYPDTRVLLNTYGDSDVISSYPLFSAILWGKLCEMFVILTSVDVIFSIR